MSAERNMHSKAIDLPKERVRKSQKESKESERKQEIEKEKRLLNRHLDRRRDISQTD